MKIINSLFLLFAFVFTVTAQEKLSATEDKALLDVLVTDMDDKIRTDDKIIFEGKYSHQIFEGISDVNGKFQILLPEGDVYLIKIKGLGDNPIDFDELNIPQQEGELSGSVVVKYRPAKQFNLDDVHFETNKAILLSSSFPTLDELAEALTFKPGLKLEIAGHTDAVGNDESNLVLSQARAEVVVTYLKEKGIDADRLTAKGYGESQPIATNDTVEGRRQNRRTEARILSF